MESEAHGPDERWRRLHPASVWVNLVPVAWRTLRSFWPLLLATVWSRGQSGASQTAGDVTLVLAFFLLSVVRTIVHWATLRYRLAKGRLEVRSGLLGRASRVIDPARIQNIELVRNIFHRAAGLVELRIETAGGSSTEGLLSALSQGEADELRRSLEAARGRAPSLIEEATAPDLWRVGAPELLVFGLSRWQAGAVTVAVLGAMQLMEQVAGVGEDAQALMAGGWKRTVALLLLAVAGTMALAAASSLIRHWRFRLWTERGRLLSEEGMFTRRRVEVPIDKVQLVRMDEPILRRLLGYSTLEIETAGLSYSPGAPAQAECVVPMVPVSDVDGLVGPVLPRVERGALREHLLPAHPRALGREVILSIVRRTLVGVVLVAGLVWAALPSGMLWVVGGLLGAWWLAGVPVAWLRWRAEGWRVTETAVVVRHGLLSRTTVVVPRNKLQAVHRTQGPLERWNRIAQVHAMVGGMGVSLPELDEEVAREIFVRLASTAGGDSTDHPEASARP